MNTIDEITVKTLEGAVELIEVSIRKFNEFEQDEALFMAAMARTGMEMPYVYAIMKAVKKFNRNYTIIIPK